MRAFFIALSLSFLALTPIVTAMTGAWWALAFTASVSENEVKGPVNIIGRNSLSPLQRGIITKYGSNKLVRVIARGAKAAIIECQRQFKHRRWNCSSNNPYNVFGKILNIACRETAFAYAITAAVVSHSVARACSDRKLKICTCDKNHREGAVTEEGWQWGGCSDNIRFADKFARKFLRSGERNKDFRTRVNIHNNEAGRAAVRNNMIFECKCHGLSQACTVKTCWKRIPDFRKVGRELKEKFDGASMVEIEQNALGKKMSFTPVNELHKPPTQSDLVYYEHSPGFCTKNPKVGSLGTVGRECNETSMGTGGCDLLCCGRGYKSEWRTETKPCDCQFIWCCRVKCDICNESRNVQTCL